MELGQIKTAKEIGRKGTYRYIRHACIVCNEERWVQIIKGEPRHQRCRNCANKQAQCPLVRMGINPSINFFPDEHIRICVNCKLDRCVLDDRTIEIDEPRIPINIYRVKKVYYKCPDCLASETLYFNNGMLEHGGKWRQEDGHIYHCAIPCQPIG